jgi:hypothetical protein
MAPWLEIIIPVRNPGTKLLETGSSLTAQTDLNFGVLLSDNQSTTGHDMVEQFHRQMASAGIPVRQVKPPYALGRVQHWNWAHAEGRAEWLKPLFVGDLLLPPYIERVRQRVEARPGAQIVRCDFEMHKGGNIHPAWAPFDQTSLTPTEFLNYYPGLGNWIGGPINVAYRREAWRGVGGYSTQLPMCADLRLNAMLALRHGLEVIHETLAVFQLHEQRFSHGIGKRRVNGCFELWLILCELRSYCLATSLPWPERGIGRAVRLQFRLDYFQYFKQQIKDSLRAYEQVRL